MLLPSYLRLSALMTCCIASSAGAYAASDEHQQLSLILRQLDSLSRLAASRDASVIDPSARYSFDYPRLSADIDLMRQGIKGYLTPSRAQPRNPPELTGHYTRSSASQP
ncbi:RAQPRD family integrative conjugative element protein [Pseudomonas sp. ATCC PTA-122608]|uniref:integrative conjugative element protein, RAQPRD family n=1 Tax=Pseudomonas sp. ATCC PTA-122608 TaxID=1771311 RepID=UPI00117A6334|nr:RAQPRD family integrative conjugative element protein [Pseudomonas sp. ATCC PTA-122608]